MIIDKIMGLQGRNTQHSLFTHSRVDYSIDDPLYLFQVLPFGFGMV